MVILPTQLLFTLLLGFMAALAAAAGAYLLYRASQKRVVVVASPAPDNAEDRQSLAVVKTLRSGHRPAMLAGAAVLLLVAFGGKFLVRGFYPAGHTPAPLMNARSSTVQGASGAQLSVLRAGPSEAPTLVFTHGWGADRRDWAYAIQSLPSRYGVVVWDLPGLGQSTPTRGRDYSMATLAADLDSVVSSVSGRPVILVGHSIGGIINLEYARRFPQKMGRDVVGLVQVDTTFTNPVETKKNAERSRKLQGPVFEPLLHAVKALSPVARGLGWLAYQSGLAHLQLASQSFAGSETWEELDDMARYAYRSSPDVVARGVLAMLHWDGSDVLPQIKVPTLVISGNQDVTTLPAASDRMAREIPLAQRVSIDQAAHLGPVEQAPRYAQAITSFADGEVKGAGPTPRMSGADGKQQ